MQHRATRIMASSCISIIIAAAVTGHDAGRPILRQAAPVRDRGLQGSACRSEFMLELAWSARELVGCWCVLALVAGMYVERS